PRRPENDSRLMVRIPVARTESTRVVQLFDSVVDATTHGGDVAKFAMSRIVPRLQVQHAEQSGNRFVRMATSAINARQRVSHIRITGVEPLRLLGRVDRAARPRRVFRLPVLPPVRTPQPGISERERRIYPD